tara:strand:+ start:255 stop:512 length:258 start_codon:yes stop_codon:yes gene_type:complete
MNIIKIDESWEMEVSNNVTLIEITKNESKKAKNEFVRSVRGYHGHIDEALKSYLRKAIKPNNEVSEIIDIIETNVKSLKSKGLIK